MVSAAAGVSNTRVTELSCYFDSLVDLVPLRNYLDPEEVLDLRSMKRDERQQAKREFKTQHKLSKRAKLDPDGEAHTTAAQRRQEADEERFRAGALVQNQGSGSGAADPGTLRERLAAKVQALKEQRKADERKEGVEKAKAWKQEQHIAAMKATKEKKREACGGDVANAQSTPDGSDIMFNRLQVKNPSQRPVATKKQSKESLLKQAESKAAEAGTEVQETADAWPKMMKLAKGEKVLDDPKLLKKSLKRAQKDKKKSKEGWKVRTDAVRKKQSDTQNKRQTNLQKKVDAKKAKKQQKREKRFLGAGFEGRTSGLRS